MLDENLPCFFYKPSTDGVKHHTSVFQTQYGSEPAPAYTLQHADPTTANARNCYASALFDSYIPDVLYGEILCKPDWTQPSLSAEEIRKNGGIPPPPTPIIPPSFTIQLYNPDQQITVTTKPGSWGGSASYEFSMPQTVFRAPSASNLDRTSHDPAADPTIPRLNFVWRRESKLSKDLTCYMTGKSTDGIAKRKHRDPDIAVALFRSLRELTVHEPNLGRVEMEDPKGLEVTLLLSAAAIRDLHFSSNVKETFNITDPGPGLQPRRTSAGAMAVARKKSSPLLAGAGALLTGTPSPPLPRPTSSSEARRLSLPRLQTTPQSTPLPSSRPPPADPRQQWEIDAETARLRAIQEEESRRRRQEEDRLRREREREAEAETRRLRRMVEEEERAARRRQEEVDRETERLKRQYGVGAPPQPQQPPRPVTSGSGQGGRRTQFLQPGPVAPPRQMGSNGLYLQPGFASTSALMSGANPAAGPARVSGTEVDGNKKMKKKSFWGLRSQSDQGQGSQRLSKKSSAMW